MATTGNFMDLLKAQLLLNQKENMLYGFIILALFEFFSGFIREFIVWSKSYLEQKFKNKVKESIVLVQPRVNELFFERAYTVRSNWDRADAILAKVLQIPESQTILVIGQLEVIKNGKEFSMTRDIKFQLTDLTLGKDGSVERVSFKVFSENKTICDLRDYIDDLVEEYLIVKKNNLGNKLYFFDHIVDKKPPRGAPVNSKVRFSKHLFITNRTLDNVFHEHQEELKHRVNFFLEHKEWYDRRGIPHTLGLLFYGIPGSGKTSSIKAIANLAQRHIININLSAIRTKKQLKKLFYDERLEVSENMESQHSTEYIIPIEKRMYVIEDIDCLDGDIVLKRDENLPGTSQLIPVSGRFNDPSGMNLLPEDDNADLDLATILNIVDGTLETPGRILIISSNYPEKLDEALIRPGRIDMIIEYKKCNHQVLREMYTSFYDQEPPSEQIQAIGEYKWTPAEVAQILFKNFRSPENALQELIELEPREYFQFSHVSNEASPEPTPEPTPEPGSPTSEPGSPPAPEEPVTPIPEPKEPTPEPAVLDNPILGRNPPLPPFHTIGGPAGMSVGSGMDVSREIDQYATNLTDEAYVQGYTSTSDYALGMMSEGSGMDNMSMEAAMRMANQAMQEAITQ